MISTEIFIKIIQRKFFRSILLLITLISLASLLPMETSLAAAPPSAAATFIITVDNSSDIVGQFSSLVMNSSGFAVISYYDKTNGNLKLAVCNDAACSSPTLRTVDGSANDVGAYPSLALNSSGFPVISYVDKTNFDLKVAVCSDATCTTTPTLTTVDSASEVDFDTSLALNSSGFPVISYIDKTNDDLKVAVCNNATCTTTPTLTTVDSVTLVAFESSMALNSSDIPFISYYDATNRNLMLAACSNTTCTSRTTTTVDDDGSVGLGNSIALNDSGRAVIAYMDTTSDDYSLKVAVCVDAACTVRTRTTVDSVGRVGFYPSLALNESDYPVISHWANPDNDLKVAVCDNADCTLRTTHTVDGAGGDSVGAFPSLALNDKGVPVISYLSSIGGQAFLSLAVCNICTAPTLTTIESTGNVGSHTSVALNDDNFPVISYVEINTSLKLAICDDSTCTNPTTTTLDSLGRVEYTSLALKDNGFPVISYYDDEDDDLELAICNDLTCTSPIFKTVDSTGLVGKYSSVALNASGFVVISYYDESDFDLKLAVCNNASCTSPNIYTVDGATKLTGAHTSLALNSSGFPVISYHNFDPQQLMLAICGDAICSSGSRTIQVIDDSGNVGWDTSLVLNSSGNAVISYYDATNDDLKLAVCNNATCTQPTLTTVDSTGNVGRFTSLALTSNDYPVISYSDDTNDDLKLAICNDIACTNPTLIRVDISGTVGDYTSLALNSSGYPVISYYDGSPNVNLKVAVFEQSAVVLTPRVYFPLIMR